jgi:hypothetical protein
MITFTITTFLLTALIIGFWYLYLKNSSTNTTKSTGVNLHIKLGEPNETHQEDSAVIPNEFNRDIKKYKSKKPVVKEPIIKEKNQIKDKPQKKDTPKKGKKIKKNKGNDLLLS